MEKKFFIIFLICFLFFACATDDIPETSLIDSSEIPVTEIIVSQETAPEPEPVSVPEPEPVSVPEPETVPELETEPVPDPIPEPAEIQNYSEEYLRSIGNLSDKDADIVPPDVFEDDKNEIFKVINDLDQIMKKKDYNRWISYLTPESYEYWSNRYNLLELSRHLFSSDDFHFNNIREYFEMFFIPARKGRLVDEIRYVTPTYVKVVQYKNKTDIIYYFFEKQDDKWLLKLDTL